jgi:hypothetical protein
MYCDWWIGQHVKTFPEYDAQDWDGLKTALLREYRREDEEQRTQTGFSQAPKYQKRSEWRRYAAIIGKPLQYCPGDWYKKGSSAAINRSNGSAMLTSQKLVAQGGWW